jgi:ADP-heptose:LPS heptosyltransferase
VRAVSRVVLDKGKAAPIEAASLRRILVLRADDRVGNVLLTTPLVRALREGLPHVRIDWLIAGRRRALVDGLFLADKLIPFDVRTMRRNPLVLAHLLWQLRANAYDAVIDAAHHDTFSLTSAMLTRWTSAPVRIGHERGDAAHFYSHPVPAPEGDRSDVAMKLALLGPLGLRPRGWQLETSLGLGPDVAEKSASVLAAARLEKTPFLVLNPGARKVERRFPPGAFGIISARIAEATGIRSLVVWGPGEEELAHETVATSKGAAVVAAATDLNLLAGLIRRAAGLITNDTGPMHLGVACGRPVLALFTVDAAARWGHAVPSFRSIAAWPGAADPVKATVEAASELLGRPALERAGSPLG